MVGAIWHGSYGMTSKSTHSDPLSKVFLTLLFLSVALAGIPTVEVHTHENATFGHSHDAHEFFDDHDINKTDLEDDDADTASYHAHDLGVTSLSIISSVSVVSAVAQHSHSYIPPPDSHLPDKIIAPLYRPPIA